MKDIDKSTHKIVDKDFRITLDIYNKSITPEKKLFLLNELENIVKRLQENRN